jgi:hypothetical protein
MSNKSDSSDLIDTLIVAVIFLLGMWIGVCYGPSKDDIYLAFIDGYNINHESKLVKARYDTSMGYAVKVENSDDIQLIICEDLCITCYQICRLVNDFPKELMYKESNE